MSTWNDYWVNDSIYQPVSYDFNSIILSKDAEEHWRSDFPPAREIDANNSYADVYQGGTTSKRYYSNPINIGIDTAVPGGGTNLIQTVIQKEEAKKPRSRNELYRGMFMRKKKTHNLTASQLTL